MKEPKRRPLAYLFWIPAGLLVIYLLFLTCFALVPSVIYWPPDRLQRRHQRQAVAERIRSAGGWAALKRGCDTLADAYKDDPYGFRSFSHDTNLPPAIAALRPKLVEFYPRSTLRELPAQAARLFGTNLVVRIAIFGAHSTGGHGQPELGLDVLCEPGITNYSPARLRSTTPETYWNYRKITDDIYEFY